jgi:hypothetical protein
LQGVLRLREQCRVGAHAPHRFLVQHKALQILGLVAGGIGGHQHLHLGRAAARPRRRRISHAGCITSPASNAKSPPIPSTAITRK